MNVEQVFLNAAKTGDQETFFEILYDLSIDIDPNHADKYGRTALILAAREGHAAIVDMTLAHFRFDPNCADGQGNTALILAAENGHSDIVSALLADARIDPNHIAEDGSDEDGFTALMYAARRGQIAVVRTLLADARVKPDHAVEHGSTALMYAAVEGEEGVVRALLADYRVDPNHVSEDGSTALTTAARVESADTCFTLLADPRINPNHADDEGMTALLYVIGGVEPEVVRALITDKRIDLSHADQAKKGIIKAIEYRDDKALRLLLKCSGQRPSVDEIAHLSERHRDFYERIFARLLSRARFRGVARVIVNLKRMRLRIAQAIYAPGGTGHAVAAASFASSATRFTKRNLEENCEFNKSSSKKPRVVR